MLIELTLCTIVNLTLSSSYIHGGVLTELCVYVQGTPEDLHPHSPPAPESVDHGLRACGRPSQSAAADGGRPGTAELLPG